MRSTIFCSSCHTVDVQHSTTNHEPVAQRGTHRRRLCLSEQRIGCARSAQCRTGCCGSRGRRGFKEYHLPRRPGGARESSAAQPVACSVYRSVAFCCSDSRRAHSVDVTECARRECGGQRHGARYTGRPDGARDRFSAKLNYLSLECTNDSCNEPYST